MTPLTFRYADNRKRVDSISGGIRDEGEMEDPVAWFPFDRRSEVGVDVDADVDIVGMMGCFGWISVVEWRFQQSTRGDAG
jgi:hypothetical protein